MLFNSIEYLLFLPVVFLVYWKLCPTVKTKNVWIILSSYFFYAWWDWRFTALLALTTIASFGSGIAIERYNAQAKRKAARLVLIANIVLNVGILCTFKYYDFFVTSFCELLQSIGLGNPTFPLLNVILPVGISFYTFQAVSYSIDVYRGSFRTERDAIAFFAYLSFFPQLVAGPIERASSILPQIRAERKFDYAASVDGMRQILWGLFKKVVIADGCAEGVEKVFSDYAHMDGATLLMGAVLFSFQIYGDFSGYCDIAIGSAKLFGIQLSQNFRTPYFAKNISEFWRRWHITLMTWFRDYIYIPIGGSRRGRTRQIIATLAVFSLSGLWHGANWTFIVWGIYHGLLVLGAAAIRKPKTATHDSHFIIKGFVACLFTFVLVMFGWILFRSATLADAAGYLSGMFTRFSLTMPLYGKTMIPLILAMLCVEWCTRNHAHPLTALASRLSPALRVGLYWLLGGFIVWYSGTGTQFIYFQF